jgi:anti-sigma factor ChrR (cupin superfamily)
MDEIDINIINLEWEDAKGYPPGAKQKVLSDGSGSTPRTILLKIPSGWKMNRHGHNYTEQHYVLEGVYESEGLTYPAGSFRVIPKGVDHGPYKTITGAVILVSYCEFHK